MKRSFLILALFASLAACRDEDNGTTTENEDACNASGYQSLIGQDETAVTQAGIEPGRKARVFGPGDAVTMDFVPDRINVELDEAGQVVRVYCG